MDHLEVDREVRQGIDGFASVTVRCSCGEAVQATGKNLKIAQEEAVEAMRSHQESEPQSDEMPNEEEIEDQGKFD